MIKSMTGFGRGEETFEGLKISVEVKSVNHRYFEFNCKVPRSYLFLEETLKPVFASRVFRGKLDVYVSVQSDTKSDKKILLNEAYLEEYLSILNQLRDEYGLRDDISVSTVAKNNEIFTVEHLELDEENFSKAVILAANKAIDKFISMRASEGSRLFDDLNLKADEILNKIKTIEKSSPETLNNYNNRLYEKIKEVLNNNSIDEQRILTEVAIFADKIAVDEEVVRLKSHFEQFKILLNSNEPVGRKLDFLVQEMNREINTIGSKAQDLSIAQIVVDIKSLIEKIREQIQNIE